MPVDKQNSLFAIPIFPIFHDKENKGNGERENIFAYNQIFMLFVAPILRNLKRKIVFNKNFPSFWQIKGKTMENERKNSK